MNLEIKALPAPLGAEVRGLDLTEDVSDQGLDQVASQIKSWLREHLVLVFRGHPIPTDAQLVRFARHFGELVVGTAFLGDRSEHPEILPITNLVDDDGVPLGTGAAAEFPWHIDYSYLERVARESFLDALELPRAQSSTYYCDLYRALETLPKARVDELRDLVAHHDLRGFIADPADREQVGRAQRLKEERNRREGIAQPPVPERDRPLIMRHPETGREALYVSPGNTRYVCGLSAEESDLLLQELFAHATRPERVYRHDWRVGDLLVVDAIGGMHRRDRFDPGDRRCMRQLSTLAV